MVGELDVVELIKQQIEYHLRQVEKLKKALVILENNNDPEIIGKAAPEKKKRVEWSKNILEIFRKNRGVPLSPQDLKTILIDEGFSQLNEPGKKNTVYTIVARLEKKGVIEKIDKGFYRLKIQHQPITDEEDIDNKR